MMQVALIGYGAWGRHHARALEAAPSAALAAIVAHGEASAAAAREERPRVAVHRDIAPVLADPAIEAVVIATPNAQHAPLALMALGAGKHVLLEKPMALTLADCDKLVTAAKASGRVLTIGHELRVSTQWGRIKALIEEGAIGAARHASLSLFRFPYRTGSGGWRYDRATVGSWVLEEPVHFFDLLLWYGTSWGSPVALRAVAQGDPAMPHALAVTLRFAGGEFATLNTVVAGFEHHVALHVLGDAGAIRSLWSAAMDRSFAPTASLHLFRGRAQPGEAAEAVPLTETGEVYELVTQAEQAIQGFRAGHALVPPEAARDAVRCCILAERSAREGREIPWNEEAVSA
ncbi:Gfo/Idh/MocA family protein [Falsiroseomonas sp.]|uniref:Gfo/Idh/MocA family protein n=1 Tax=Falsiroseomonas sp. TaxID=2870721 RepID=UPI003561565B